MEAEIITPLGTALPPVQLDLHQADMARRQKERDAKRELIIACTNPEVAASHELTKPHYFWTVNATWHTPTERGLAETKKSASGLVGQDERDAWAVFCDTIKASPSRRFAKVEFIKGEQLTAEQVAGKLLSPTFRY